MDISFIITIVKERIAQFIISGSDRRKMQEDFLNFFLFPFVFAGFALPFESSTLQLATSSGHVRERVRLVPVVVLEPHHHPLLLLLRKLFCNQAILPQGTSRGVVVQDGPAGRERPYLQIHDRLRFEGRDTDLDLVVPVIAHQV